VDDHAKLLRENNKFKRLAVIVLLLIDVHDLYTKIRVIRVTVLLPHCKPTVQLRAKADSLHMSSLFHEFNASYDFIFTRSRRGSKQFSFVILNTIKPHVFVRND